MRTSHVSKALSLHGRIMKTASVSHICESPLLHDLNLKGHILEWPYLCMIASLSIVFVSGRNYVSVWPRFVSLSGHIYLRRIVLWRVLVWLYLHVPQHRKVVTTSTCGRISMWSNQHVAASPSPKPETCIRIWCIFEDRNRITKTT